MDALGFINAGIGLTSLVLIFFILRDMRKEDKLLKEIKENNEQIAILAKVIIKNVNIIKRSK